MRHPRSIPSYPFSPAPLAVAVALSMLLSLGWLVAPAPAAAQDEDELVAAGVDGDAYESPTFGYTVEWDGDIWEAREADTDDRDGDFLYLSSIGGSDLYFEGSEGLDGDPADCLDEAIASIEEDDRVTEFAPLLDENDEPVEGAGELSAFAAYSYIVTIRDEPVPITQYSECRVLVEGEAVLQIDHLAPQDDYGAESALVAEVLDTLSVPGSEPADDTEPAEQPTSESEATPADDADPADDAATPTEAEDDPTPTEEPADVEAADDDADATATAESDDVEATEAAGAAPTEEAADDEPTPTEAGEDEDEEPTAEAETDEAEPTEAAGDDAEPNEEPEGAVDPDDLEGVEDDTYTSPTYGYTLEWDADLWSPREATSEDDVDTLVLSNDVSTLTLVGTAEFGENLDRCVRTARRGIEAGADVEDVTPTLDADGEPIEIDEDDRAGGVYSVFLDDPDGPPDLVAQIECRVAVPGEAVIQIVQVTEAADFNAEIEPVGAVLDSITLQEEETEEPEESPAPEDEPTPADEQAPEDDEPEEEQESAVDGNAYVSPNFGYSLEWDEDVWEFDPEAESSEPGFDTLFLSSRNSGLAIIGAEVPDPETCVDDFSGFLRTEPEVDDWAPLEDDDGERIEGERDGGYFAAFSLTMTQAGQEFEAIYYFECRTVIEGESVVLFFLSTGPDAYDDATAELDDLLDTLIIPGSDADEDDPAPTPADEDEDAEPTPEDQDQDADPTPTDDEQDADEDTASGADLDSYTDPDFPFTLSWDESTWTVTDQRTVDDGHNVLNLTADGSDLTIEGWARWDGVPTDCLNDITLNLRATDGVQDFARVSDTDLYPESASPSGAYALYSFTLAPEGRTPVEYYGYVECRTVVEGEAVVVLTLVVPADEYDALRPDFDPILASIEIDG